MKFQLNESDSRTAVGLKIGKNSRNWVSVLHFRELNLKIKAKCQNFDR